MPIGGIPTNHGTPGHCIFVLHIVKHRPCLFHLPAFHIQVQCRSCHKHTPRDPLLLCRPPHRLAGHQISGTGTRGQDPDSREAVRTHATLKCLPCNANGFLDTPGVHVRGDERGPRNRAGAGHFVERLVGVVHKAALCVQVEEGCEDVRVGVARQLERAAMELHGGVEWVGEAGGGLEREGKGEVGWVGDDGVEAYGVEVQASGRERAEEERGEIGEEVKAEDAAVEELDRERWELFARAYAGEEATDCGGEGIGVLVEVGVGGDRGGGGGEGSEEGEMVGGGAPAAAEAHRPGRAGGAGSGHRTRSLAM
nr:unnamed protein product [Digitaria exilis]